MASLTRVFGTRAAFFCTIFALASSTLAPVAAFAIPLPKKDESKNTTSKILQLEAELKIQRDTIADLREKNLVLTSKIERERRQASTSKAETEVTNEASGDVSGAISGEAPTLTWPATAEYLLYSKVIDSYQKRRIPDLTRSTQLLIKGYPQSVYGDNALYLQARLQVSTGAYQEALDSIARLETQFPDGDKKVSALFLKGEIYEHMKQTARAQETFKMVARDFPGSPESLQLLDRQLAQGDRN